MAAGTIIRFIVFYLHINLGYQQFPIPLHLAKVFLDSIILCLLLLLVGPFFNKPTSNRYKIVIYLGSLIYLILATTGKLAYSPTIFRIRQIFFIAIPCYALTSIFINAKKCRDTNLKKTASIVGIITLLMFAIIFLAHIIFAKKVQSSFYLIYLNFVVLWNFNSLFYIYRYLNRSTHSTILFNQYNLTQREQEITQLLAQGFSNKKIADKLFISQYTVKNHIQHIAKKMNVSTKLEILAAFQNR